MILFVLSVLFYLSKNSVGAPNEQKLAINSLDNQWNVFKIQFNKTFLASRREETRRRLIWESNLRMINMHNREAILGKHTYFMSMNKYGDMTHSEFKKLLGLKKKTELDIETFSKDILSGMTMSRMIKNNPRNNSVDWRSKGYVTRVKDQGSCGSCWAFSAIASLEGQIFKKYGKLVDLSEQNLVDCSKNDYNDGCNGGFMDSAYKYIMNNGGIDTSEVYPYEGKDGDCRFKSESVGANVKSFRYVTLGDENDLTRTIENIGPVSVAIDASPESFQFYSSGIFYEHNCSPIFLNHAVTVVGYGSQGNGLDYYIVKNSWGDTWGEKGYILMARNKNNNCGIASEAVYPLV